MVVLALLYWHAYRKRDDLGLNEFEVYETKHSVRRLVAAAGVGITYFAIAFLDTMPVHTPGEKRIFRMATVAVFVALAALLGRMVFLVRDRKRVRNDWKARHMETSPQPPEE